MRAIVETISRRQFLAGSIALGIARMPMPALADSVCAERRGLVILAEFPGLPRPFPASFVAEKFRRLGHYVQAMSYGRTCAAFDLTDWHLLPEPITSYAISPINLKVDKSRVHRLIQDAIDAADESHEFSRYDFLVIFMRARFDDYGMVGLCGYPGMLGWQQEFRLKTSRRGQAVPNGVAIFTATAHIGTLFHDIAHIWGGVVNGKRRVPCLYDHDLQARYPTRAAGWENSLINMGYWDPMSCHLYKAELPPPGISSWTKLRLGWLPPEKVRDVDPATPTEVLLGPLEDGNSETLAIRIRLSASRYLLIENRQPLGNYDRVLPRHGVLIMKANDDIDECRHGRSPVRLVDANPQEKALIGAAFDLPERSRYLDPEYGLEIRLIEKVGHSYRIRIGKGG